MKNVPNILSVSRLLISGLLLFTGNHPVIFTILYLYCGISDVADGYIARRWKVESATGAKLDSFGDLVFYAVVTVLFFTRTALMKDGVVLGLVLAVFILKLLNVIIIRAKFHQWGMLHTIGNKLSGLLVYFLLPVYVLFPSTPVIPGMVVVIIALAASLEETFMLLRAKQYNPNLKSIFDNRSNRTE